MLHSSSRGSDFKFCWDVFLCWWSLSDIWATVFPLSVVHSKGQTLCGGVVLGYSEIRSAAHNKAEYIISVGGPGFNHDLSNHFFLPFSREQLLLQSQRGSGLRRTVAECTNRFSNVWLGAKKNLAANHWASKGGSSWHCRRINMNHKVKVALTNIWTHSQLHVMLQLE